MNGWFLVVEHSEKNMDDEVPMEQSWNHGSISQSTTSLDKKILCFLQIVHLYRIFH